MKKTTMGIAVVFALGAAALAWVGWGYVGTSSLALAMTLAIAAVYLAGALELAHFRAATSSLAAALAGATEEPPDDLAPWLERLHPMLRQPVRQRIAGERTALPGPALAPYLVGLLVMLGMLGTFLGMVMTFQGAVFALESSASLDAMRAALAAPVRGLGVAFGTSVAGVAASAMLGLMATLARRERLGAVRHLDARIASTFRAFSARRRQDETLQALNAQAQALPLIAQRLETLAAGLERRQETLVGQLVEQQQGFHREAAVAYAGLASAVGTALNESMAASVRAAGDTLRPVVEGAMTALAEESRRAHQRTEEVAAARMDGLAAQWKATAHDVARTWTDALQSHTQLHDRLGTRFDAALGHVTQGFDERSQALLQSLQALAAQTQKDHAAADAQRSADWGVHMQSLAEALAAQWQAASERAANQLQAVCASMEDTAAGIVERLDAQAARTVDGAARVIAQSEALVRARTETEERWLVEQGERMDALAGVWRAELNALSDAEAVRGRAAVDRLDALQAAAAQHLAALGAALEAPLHQLLQTASEVPQAAAQVIAQLRGEMAQLAERDNRTVAERTAMAQQLGQLLEIVGEAAVQQREAVAAAAGGAAAALEQAAAQFGDALAAQSGQAEEAAVRVAASAVELSALGEAFAHGMGLFTASNQQLMESLQRIEAAIGRSIHRSDEQLAYYVAQAREVIDLSIASQQGIVEDLRRLHGKAGAAAVLEAAG